MTADTQQPVFLLNKNRRVSMCVGCGSQIHDPFILRVSPDLEWHANCLKCVDCNQHLDENCTCFVKDGKTYCRTDYNRLFGTKCSKCHQICTKNDFVMRARENMYHIDCFRCVACNRQLIPGDEFALKDGELFCRADHEGLENDLDNNTDIDIKCENNEFQMEIPNNDSNNNSKKKENGSYKQKGGREKSKNGEPKRKSDQKPTRGRTVLNEKQLHTLCTWYNANPRPDALMKEQLVEMTNLSPRVIRVWFQNKRCKDNKRSILNKQIQQQQEEKNAINLCGSLQGVPMVASSPVQHDSGVQMNPIEVHSYQQPPWQTYNTLPVKQEHQPALQQLMNSFDSIDSDSASSYHQNNSGFHDGYVWGRTDYDNNTQFSDSEYNQESRMSSSPLSQ